jgi:hypothetical protein
MIWAEFGFCGTNPSWMYWSRKNEPKSRLLGTGVFGDDSRRKCLATHENGASDANDRKVAVHRHCDSGRVCLRGMFSHGVVLSWGFEKTNPFRERLRVGFGFCRTNPSRVSRQNEPKFRWPASRCSPIHRQISLSLDWAWFAILLRVKHNAIGKISYVIDNSNKVGCDWVLG